MKFFNLLLVRLSCFMLLISGFQQLGFGAETTQHQRIDPSGISGSLIICGGGKLEAKVIDRFLKLAGGEKARLVVIPTAASNIDEKTRQQHLDRWKNRKIKNVTVLHTTNQKTANSDPFIAPLKNATAVWISGGHQSRIAKAYLGTKVEQELYNLLKRGGVIGGTSAGAAIQSKVMIASGKQTATIAQGFDFLPGTIIDQHFSQRKRITRLQGAIQKHPNLIGIGIDEQTAIEVRGRRFRVVGKGTITIRLAAASNRKALQYQLKPGKFADLTALRRAAILRGSDTIFPPNVPASPEVKDGSLMIIGGGGFPKGAIKKFIELAGGNDAPIIVLPTASGTPFHSPRNRGMQRILQQAGAKNVTTLPHRTLEQVNSSEFISALKKAKGVWFGGGRQWRFVDAYAGTKAYDLFHDVLKRGGVIAGSSAGASIQAEYMARGDPLGNLNIMAEGYERGFNFLGGVAIDQHFTQRKRHADMKQLVTHYPQLLGIGIDETTALIVQGHVAKVIGPNQVYFYRQDKLNQKQLPPPQIVGNGGKYDLKARKILVAGSQPKVKKVDDASKGD